MVQLLLLSVACPTSPESAVEIQTPRRLFLFLSPPGNPTYPFLPFSSQLLNYGSASSHSVRISYSSLPSWLPCVAMMVDKCTSSTAFPNQLNRNCVSCGASSNCVCAGIRTTLPGLAAVTPLLSLTLECTWQTWPSLKKEHQTLRKKALSISPKCEW